MYAWDPNTFETLTGDAKCSHNVDYAKTKFNVTVPGTAKWRQYKTESRWVEGENYEYHRVQVKGSKEWCEKEKDCNWGSWSQPITSQSECENEPGVAVADGKQMFCGVCWGDYCEEMSKKAECKMNSWVNNAPYNASTCNAFGGEWRTNKAEFWEGAKCYKDANTLDACIPSVVRALPETHT